MDEPTHIGQVIAELEGRIACPSCGGDDQIKTTFGPHPGGHHARLDCERCKRFIRWLPKPENNGKRPSQAKLLRRFSNGYCEMCRRSKDEIPLPGTLEAHHVIPWSEGGGNERENIWILCTCCHRQVEHLRVYLGHYHHKPGGGE